MIDPKRLPARPTRDQVRVLQRQLVAAGYAIGPTGVDGIMGRRTRAALDRFQASSAPTVASMGGMTGLGPTKDGLTIPRGQGRATAFWNGHIAYKGQYDWHNRQNGGIGAWGDRNAPTEYFVALPVGQRKWHNQKILITNPATGQQVVARVQDKGPGRGTGAAIDLSPVTMEALGGDFRGILKHVTFEFAPEDAPVGPVR